MIAPVWATLIDIAVSMKARLDRYTKAYGTLIFDNYDECAPKNHAKFAGRDITGDANNTLEISIMLDSFVQGLDE